MLKEKNPEGFNVSFEYIKKKFTKTKSAQIEDDTIAANLKDTTTFVDCF
jgi:hypothetical protein